MYKTIKYIFLIGLIFSNLSFSEVFWKKNNFIVNVNETTTVNNRNKSKSYNLTYNNNEIKMEVLSPNANKGEVYTITKNQKTIYYPRLNQTVTQSLDENEYSLLEILNDLKKLKGTSTQTLNGKNYIFSNNQLIEIKNNDYIIKFSNYRKSGNYEYPRNILITSGNTKINYILNNFK